MTMRGAMVGLLIGLSLASAQAEDRKPELRATEQEGVQDFSVGGPESYDDVLLEVLELTEMSAKATPTIIAEIQKQRDEIPPLFLYALAHRLYPTDKEEAFYVFMLAEMRARYDILRCQDASAQEALTVARIQLAKAVEPIAGMARADKAFYGKMLRLVKSRNEVFKSNGSPWWACSHGMMAIQAAMDGATLKSDQWLRPKSDWKQLQAKINKELDASIAKY